MIKLEIISDQEPIEPLIKSAINFEITRLEIGLKNTARELQKFETKYQVSSNKFSQKYTAEDLLGGDDEYVTWMGEIKLHEKIQAELNQLKAIENEERCYCYHTNHINHSSKQRSIQHQNLP